MTRFFRVLGVAIQILVLGQLLFLALLKWYGVEAGARIFRYAGY